MENTARALSVIQTSADLSTAVSLTFPDVPAANEIVPVSRPQAQQPVRVISAAHFAQMCAPGSDCI